MPMPHRTQMQVIKRRLVGKDGSERIRELRAILAELPGYRNGPYADLRKWVQREIEATRVRKRVVHRDSIAVRREGAAQVALVGPPNAGKSSLLQALSSVAIKTGDYAFTTTRDEAAPFVHPELEVGPVSVLDDASLDAFGRAGWRLTGLLRLALREGE